jgi:hypothetical protein
MDTEKVLSPKSLPPHLYPEYVSPQQLSHAHLSTQTPPQYHSPEHSTSPEQQHPPQRHPPQALPETPSQEHSMQTPYMVMCIQADQARRRYTISAAVFTWLILAGYLVIPNTFTSLQSSKVLSGSKGGKIIQSTVQNVQLLPFAGALCLIGTVGISWLWSRWRTNYVWLIRNIFT